jgi:hypothetical protein
MLPLTPHFLVLTATAYASCKYQQSAEDAEQDRANADAARGDASLRFVHFAGFWSHFTHLGRCSSWPLPASDHIEEFVEVAEQFNGIAPTPLAGDVFLLASPDAARHVRAGIVAAVETTRTMLNGCLAFVCTTIEGELGADHSVSRVPAARLVRRRLSLAFGDCFVRWWGLAAQTSPAVVEYKVPKNLITLDRVRRRRAA